MLYFFLENSLSAILPTELDRMHRHGRGSIFGVQVALFCLAVVVRSAAAFQRGGDVESITFSSRGQARSEGMGQSLLQVGGQGGHEVESLDEGTGFSGGDAKGRAKAPLADRSRGRGVATAEERELFAKAHLRARRDYVQRSRGADSGGTLGRAKRGGGELGEGAPGAAARNAEKQKQHEILTKAAEKTTKGIETVKSQNAAFTADKKRTMEELVEKNTQIRDDSVRKAEELLRDAPADWAAKWNKKMGYVKEKWDAVREKGQKYLREMESKVAVKKTTSATKWMQKITKARESVNKLQEGQKADYLQQMSIYDQSQSKLIEKAKVAYAKEVAGMKKLQDQSSENMGSQSEAVKAKYRNLIKGVERTKKTTLKKLMGLQDGVATEAKKRLAANKVQFKNNAALAKRNHKEAVEQSKATLGQAGSVKAQLDANIANVKKFDKQYKDKLDGLKLNAQQKQNEIQNNIRTAKAKAKSDLRSTKEEEKSKVEKVMDDETQNEEKHKEKELSWETKARMNSRQDCEDARESANMKAKAAKFAAHRVSRDAQSEALITNNHWLDSEKKVRDLNKQKEKQEKALERASAKEAIEMAHAMYGKEPQVYDVDTKWPSEAMSSVEPRVVKIPNKLHLEQVSGKFASTFVPADKEIKVATTRSVEASKAKLIAAKHTWVWANNHASQIARTVHEKAEKTCVRSRQFFNEAERTVISRVGEIWSDKKTLLTAAEANATMWANATRKKIYATEDDALVRDKKVLKEIAKASSDESNAVTADAKKKIAEDQKTIDDGKVQYEKLKSDGKLKGEFAKTSLTNDLKEVQQERELKDKEATGMETKQIKRGAEEKTKLEEQSVKQVDNYKQREIDSLEQLKDTAGPVSAGQFAEQDAKLKAERDDAIHGAKADFKIKFDRLNSGSKKEVEKATAAAKLKVSKYKSAMKQDLAGEDEFLQKMIVKEKQKQQAIDLIKEQSDEKGQKEKAHFIAQVTTQKYNLEKDAREKMSAADRIAKNDFSTKVHKRAEETTKLIHAVKDKVLATFDVPGE